MPYNLVNYRHAINTDIRRWEERLGHADLVLLAEKVVQASDCPCIVAAHLVGEMYEYDEALNEWIDHLTTWSSNNTVIGRLDDKEDKAMP